MNESTNCFSYVNCCEALNQEIPQNVQNLGDSVNHLQKYKTKLI